MAQYRVTARNNPVIKGKQLTEGDLVDLDGRQKEDRAIINQLTEPGRETLVDVKAEKVRQAAELEAKGDDDEQAE